VTDWVADIDWVKLNVATCEPDADPLSDSVPVEDRVRVIDCVSLSVNDCDGVPLDVGNCDRVV
jgi:hypothetical protein